jgi:hypothetical protein
MIKSAKPMSDGFNLKSTVPQAALTRQTTRPHGQGVDWANRRGLARPERFERPTLRFVV